MKFSKLGLIALVISLSFVIQGLPPLEAPARAAESQEKKESPKKKAAPKGGELTVPETPPIEHDPVPASELTQPEELSQPPSEPLPMPLEITQVDSKNPESVALAEAQRSGKRVEIPSARTETTSSYANPTGTITTEVSSGPVRVKKGKDWAPIDTTLQFTADGVAPKAALGQTKLSKGGEKGSVLAATGGDGKRVSFQTEHALPTPTLSGDTATYSDVAPGQDLVVKATPTGFESFVVLKTRPEQPPVISVPLGLDGLVVRKEQSGELCRRQGRGPGGLSHRGHVVGLARSKNRRTQPGAHG